MSYVRVVSQSVLITFTFFLCWFWNMLFRMIIAAHGAYPSWMVSLQIFWLGAVGFGNSIIWFPFIRLAVQRVSVCYLFALWLIHLICFVDLFDRREKEWNQCLQCWYQEQPQISWDQQNQISFLFNNHNNKHNHLSILSSKSTIQLIRTFHFHTTPLLKSRHVRIWSLLPLIGLLKWVKWKSERGVEELLEERERVQRQQTAIIRVY